MKCPEVGDRFFAGPSRHAVSAQVKRAEGALEKVKYKKVNMREHFSCLVGVD